MPSVFSIVLTSDLNVADRDSASAIGNAIRWFDDRTRGIGDAAILETASRTIRLQHMRERELRAIRHLNFHLRTLRSVFKRYRRARPLPG